MPGSGGAGRVKASGRAGARQRAGGGGPRDVRGVGRGGMIAPVVTRSRHRITRGDPPTQSRGAAGQYVYMFM